CECPHRLSDSVVKERGNREVCSGLRGCVSYAFLFQCQALFFGAFHFVISTSLRVCRDNGCAL
ncbi:hypothetical protein, partial [Xenorhabdus mauleonii]|uniref:hypothetical protein n=1 Tax=Xenorhabdus mauleonii TaxID=351675 RepID=UPI001C318926